MPVPKFDAFFTPILQFSQDGAEHTFPDTVQYCVNHFALTEDDCNELLGSGRQTKLNNRVNWALTYLRKAGLAETIKRGVYVLSNEGRKVLDEKGADVVTIEFLQQYESFRKFLGNENQGSKPENPGITPPETPEEVLVNAYETLTTQLADDLLEKLHQLTPSAFEHLVTDLLLCMGYGSPSDNVHAVTKLSHDGGIDAIISSDKLGFEKIYIQAKRYAKNHNVGSPDLQRFVGACSGKKGVFITTSSFTQDAIEYAAKQSTHTLVLIDGKRLARLMIEHDFGVSTEQVFKVKRIDSDFFDEFANPVPEHSAKQA